MTQEKSDLIKGWPVYLVFLILIAVVIWALKNQPSRPFSEPLAKSISQSIAPGEQADASGEDKQDAFHTAETYIVQPTPSNAKEPLGLQEIISNRRTWKPVWSDWYGKIAEDFSFQDINAMQHKLSDYRGKNVLVIFWATWCAPCHVEIPHLVELRNTIGEDELEILAISNEHITRLKQFAADKNLNYTVISSRLSSPVPAPFRYVRGIPAGFFIDKEGKIKLATEGLVSLTELLQILRAKN
jgi:peroxiredoxin